MVREVRLYRDGVENDLYAHVVVEINFNGQWYELIRELVNSQFDHYANVDLLFAKKMPV